MTLKINKFKLIFYFKQPISKNSIDCLFYPSWVLKSILSNKCWGGGYLWHGKVHVNK